MMLRLLLPLSVLALVATGDAQQEADTSLITKNPLATASVDTRETKPDPGATFHLTAGSLPEVVGQIEQWLPNLNKQGNASWTMPNVIFDEAARALRVPADLRLRKVTPVQALALVAAAAGCTLESVTAPQEGVPSLDPSIASSPVIGYRIVAGAPQLKVDELIGIGISLMSKDGAIFVGEVYPNTPAARSGKIKAGDRLVSVAERGSPPVQLQGMPVEKAAKLIRGRAGSIIELQVQSDDSNAVVSLPLVREKMDLASRAQAANVPVYAANPAGGEILGMAPGQFGGVAGLTLTQPTATPDPARPRWSPADPYGAFAKASQPGGLVTRVYATGTLFSGTEEESEEKQKTFRELVLIALNKGDATRDSKPYISFHSRSKTLVIKATPDEHALVQEVLAALKENETSNTPGTTIRRR